MLLGIAWNVFAVVFHLFIMPSMSEMPVLPDRNFEVMMNIMRVFSFKPLNNLPKIVI
jgi:hypothetical protein